MVATEECSKRLFAILTEGQEVTETAVKQEMEQDSDFTTYETADGKYKLSLYETTEMISCGLRRTMTGMGR